MPEKLCVIQMCGIIPYRNLMLLLYTGDAVLGVSKFKI